MQAAAQYQFPVLFIENYAISTLVLICCSNYKCKYLSNVNCNYVITTVAYKRQCLNLQLFNLTLILIIEIHFVDTFLEFE